MIEVIKNEWKGLIRNKLVLYLGIFSALALCLVCWVSLVQVEQQQQLREEAQQHVREQWDNMGPSNPHGAAHYGTYAFKPQNTMGSVDEGVYAVTERNGFFPGFSIIDGFFIWKIKTSPHFSVHDPPSAHFSIIFLRKWRAGIGQAKTAAGSGFIGSKDYSLQSHRYMGFWFVDVGSRIICVFSDT